MFRFFTQRNWFLWSWIGSAIILSSLWIQVKIDVKINEWFGEFYDMIQKALGAPNSITIEEYWASLISFITLAAMYVGVAVVVSFFTSHYLFRWRTAMVEWYHSVYDKARKIEGAAQRVQEDTIKFSRIMESLGTSLIEALMILVEFMPILFGLSIGIPIFFFGDWDYGLIVGALIWSVGGTIFLILLGLILRLVGVEYDLQKKEAAYRKILVIAEDDGTVRPKTIEELFDGVRSIHFLSLKNEYFSHHQIILQWFLVLLFHRLQQLQVFFYRLLLFFGDHIPLQLILKLNLVKLKILSLQLTKLKHQLLTHNPNHQKRILVFLYLIQIR